MLEPWKKAIKEKGFYHLHSCGGCGYECGWAYTFRSGGEEVLVYDSGCDCTYRRTLKLAPDDQLRFYLEPAHGHIEKIEAYIKEPTDTDAGEG